MKMFSNPRIWCKKIFGWPTLILSPYFHIAMALEEGNIVCTFPVAMALEEGHIVCTFLNSRARGEPNDTENKNFPKM